MAKRRSLNGAVDSFDHSVGLGDVVGDDGVRRSFHCTAIADGSRAIAVGAEVRYRVVPGRLGRWEVTDIEPLTRPVPSPPTPA